MRTFTLSLILVLAAPALGALAPGQIANLVTFGDSYTDVVNIGDGGVAWPRTLWTTPAPKGSLSQLPAYFAEVDNGTLPADVTADNTLYTLWIGTNDVGANALLTGQGIDGATIVDTVGCAVDWVQMIPLETAPMYSPNAYPTKFYTAPKNATEWSIAELLLKQLAPSLEGASVGEFGPCRLVLHLLAYLNGTAPLNVTGAAFACVPTCTTVEGTDRDSYLWYDELHPSEQADRVVAEQVAQVILGEENQWTTWLS
ncbi:hypothetical protein BD626DRAFT_618757 [Schizophyllum amplum]|uniref:GDSL lipase/esterase n=1 Tax=Schizophyllum amplum TaxID=97359 RepID=A0A550BVX6_9AGAR|nr:hypothetical protein BD626DRAFT_618757 [Auriculariopsis ampla]